MDYWHRELGVGPWYYNPRVPIRNYRYRGERYEPHNSVALANSGPMQVELIQTRNDVPSMYRDFLRAGHRACSTSPTGPSASTPTWRAPQAQGFTVVHERRGRRDAAASCYFEDRAHAGLHPGTVIELSEVAGPEGQAVRPDPRRRAGLGRQRPGAALPRPLEALSASHARAIASRATLPDRDAARSGPGGRGAGRRAVLRHLRARRTARPTRCARAARATVERDRGARAGRRRRACPTPGSSARRSRDRGGARACGCRFPSANIGANLPTLAATVAGNLYDLGEVTGPAARVADAARRRTAARFELPAPGHRRHAPR